MTDSSVNPGEASVNGLDFEPYEDRFEPNDDRDDDEEFRESWDEGFRQRQEDARIEAQQRQDAQVSRAEQDYLAGGN